MAKKTFGHQVELGVAYDKKGGTRIVATSVEAVEEPALTRAQRKSLTPMPWTAGPQTRWEKFKRAAIG